MTTKIYGSLSNVLRKPAAVAEPWKGVDGDGGEDPKEDP